MDECIAPLNGAVFCFAKNRDFSAPASHRERVPYRPKGQTSPYAYTEKIIQFLLLYVKQKAPGNGGREDAESTYKDVGDFSTQAFQAFGRNDRGKGNEISRLRSR